MSFPSGHSKAPAESKPSPEVLSGPGYVCSAAEKAALALPCLRQKLFPRRALFAGPFIGEFGYELMQWQGFVRARRKHYAEAHVLTYPGRDYLYEGCVVHHHNADLRTAGYGYGRLSPNEAREMARRKADELGLRDYDIFDPSMLCTRYHKLLFWRQDFRIFEEQPVDGRVRHIAFHFRAVKKEGPDHAKNYSPERAAELVAECRGAGLEVICIGHPNYSICPAGAEDHRYVDLQKTVAAICSARVVAGENSGPMHLANLCGKATILWAQDQWRIDYSLRWNPFRVPIYVAANDSCQPDSQQVRAAITSALDDLKRRTEDFTRPAYQLPAQRIAPF
jgi:hypothetical protein